LGRINVVLSDEVEHRLRRALVDNPDFGGREGDLSEAIELAISEWLDAGAPSVANKKRK
jgi:hypothetical protein